MLKKGGSRLHVKLTKQREGLGVARPCFRRIKQRMQLGHVTTVYTEMLLADAFESSELGWLNHAVRKHDPEKNEDFRQHYRIFRNLPKRPRQMALWFEKLRDRSQKYFHEQSPPEARAIPNIRKNLTRYFRLSSFNLRAIGRGAFYSPSPPRPAAWKI